MAHAAEQLRPVLKGHKPMTLVVGTTSATQLS